LKQESRDFESCEVQLSIWQAYLQNKPLQQIRALLIKGMILISRKVAKAQRERVSKIKINDFIPHLCNAQISFAYANLYNCVGAKFSPMLYLRTSVLMARL
jgi:hypothetical protein